jgi:hypothetical protein
LGYYNAESPLPAAAVRRGDGSVLTRSSFAMIAPILWWCCRSIDAELALDGRSR